MEMKYVVLKKDDILLYCTAAEEQGLRQATTSIMKGREAEGKPAENRYLVINTDEPYADEVIEILKKHGHWG